MEDAGTSGWLRLACLGSNGFVGKLFYGYTTNDSNQHHCFPLDKRSGSRVCSRWYDFVTRERYRKRGEHIVDPLQPLCFSNLLHQRRMPSELRSTPYRWNQPDISIFAGHRLMPWATMSYVSVITLLCSLGAMLKILLHRDRVRVNRGALWAYRKSLFWIGRWVSVHWFKHSHFKKLTRSVDW